MIAITSHARHYVVFSHEMVNEINPICHLIQERAWKDMKNFLIAVYYIPIDRLMCRLCHYDNILDFHLTLLDKLELQFSQFFLDG